ncbi:hypothetical protein [Streptomyces boncukensis]|uniref:hypothetical protein n=1 Tax=Streptomyces boncukensis TaxID=2711219 RepID=UPI0019D240E7|nr:hypothetical protein [Streptomyces boncukensis]
MVPAVDNALFFDADGDKSRGIPRPSAGCLAQRADLRGLSPFEHLVGQDLRPVLLDLRSACLSDSGVPLALLLGLTTFSLLLATFHL